MDTFEGQKGSARVRGAGENDQRKRPIGLAWGETEKEEFLTPPSSETRGWTG